MNDRAYLMARAVAMVNHHGQVDKAGAPYIGHVRRVLARVAGNDDAMVVAWLHDILEDTSVTAKALRQVFPGHIVDAVEAITHRKNEPRVEYYARVKANELARIVKLADVADNSDPDRLAKLDEATRARLEKKYAQARAALEASDD